MSIFITIVGVVVLGLVLFLVRRKRAAPDQRSNAAQLLKSLSHRISLGNRLDLAGEFCHSVV